MRYDAIIKSHLLDNIPEKVKLNDGATMTIEEAKVIITEFDKTVDPISCYGGFDKGFTVAVGAIGVIKRFEREESNPLRCNVTVEKEHIGEYKVFPIDATFKEMMEGANDIINRVFKKENA